MLDHVIWSVPARVTHTQFSGLLSLGDIEQSNRLSYALMDSEESSSEVFAIVDITRCEGFSSDLMSMSAMRGLTTIHPKMRWLVAVEGVTNPAFRFVAISIIKVMRLKYTIVQSAPEAVDFIRHLDPSIEPF